MDEPIVVVLPNTAQLVNEGEFLSLCDNDGTRYNLGTVWEFVEKLVGAPIITMELGETDEQ